MKEFPGNNSKEKKKVLILEDRYIIRKTIKYILIDAGYSIFEAENGVCALEQLNGRTFDLFIASRNVALVNFFIESIYQDPEYSTHRATPVVMMDDDVRIESAVETYESIKTMSPLFQIEELLNTVGSLVIS